MAIKKRQLNIENHDYDYYKQKALNDVLPKPKNINVQDLFMMLHHADNDTTIEKHYRERIKSPLTAIRAFCVLCTQSPKGSYNCENITCPLWSFRQGSNPFFNRS